ncbi:MAG: XRE family transcriptional regulator [Osedax symbiont Rs2]|nr:MAG: XRE family transcriptional regulator [Osedax symbiont Rs2]
MKNRVKVLRTQKGWSQQQLADLLGVSRQAINAIERDKHDPSLKLAFELAKIFSSDVQSMFHPDSSEDQ